MPLPVVRSLRAPSKGGFWDKGCLPPSSGWVVAGISQRVLFHPAARSWSLTPTGIIRPMAMDNADILAALDEQIRTLQKVKALLEGKPSRTARALKKAGGRVLSDEARAKIAAAQKARWARVKKAKK
jgi:hypothetical protein